MAEGGTAVALGADITRTDGCKMIPEACVERWDGIDILINVVVGENTRRLEISEEEFDRIHSINTRAMMLVCEHVVPVMEK